jgi:hypothetical protein
MKHEIKNSIHPYCCGQRIKKIVKKLNEDGIQHG